MENLSHKAQRILAETAEKEAIRFKAETLLPDHIALAILKEEEGTAAEILRQLGSPAPSVRALLEELVERGTLADPQAKRPFSPRAQKVLEAAKIEADAMESREINLEHLFLAIFCDTESALFVCLEKFGISPDDFRIALAEHSRNLNQQRQKRRQEDTPPFYANDPLRRSREGSKRQESALETYCRDLTRMAEENKIDPIIGRDAETLQLLRILMRRAKNNPALVGEAGVGKTSVVEGVALRIAQKLVPDAFMAKRIYILDIASLIAGTRYRGEFEERIKRLINELQNNPNAILFIDELHTIVGAGGAEGALDASNIFKPALARGEIQCIGATTYAEYRKHIEKDAALARRFQVVKVAEPSKEETLIILRGIKSRYEQTHTIEYDNEALYEAVELSCRYLNDRRLPDKAIDLLDEAGAQKRLERFNIPARLNQLESRFLFLEAEIENCIQMNNQERALSLKEELVSQQKKALALSEEWKTLQRGPKDRVTKRDIERIVSETVGIPEKNLTGSQFERLMNLEHQLKQEVVGQDEAIEAVCAAVRRSLAGLASPSRPSASFLFVGPTGVGKTLLAKRLAEYLFDQKEALIRIDMSEYSEKHNAARLIGAPPGYVGYEEGGMLTERVRRCPYCIVLFDELEKAHPDIFNMLLQILDDGTLQDGLGRSVSFNNAIIIMTSNAGSRDILQNRAGFDSAPRMENSAKTVMNELKKIFLPEFLNRIDEILPFKHLSQTHVREILELELADIAQRLRKERGLRLAVSLTAKNYLAQKAFNAAFGARNLKRLLRKEIEDQLALTALKLGEKHADLTIDLMGEKLEICVQSAVQTLINY